MSTEAAVAHVLASRYADGVLTFLGEAGVVDDPGLDRTMLLDQRQHPGSDQSEHGRVRPVGLGDQVVQRLVGGLDPAGLDPSGHPLDALAVARQQQAGAVAPSRGNPVSMAEGHTK